MYMFFYKALKDERGQVMHSLKLLQTPDGIDIHVGFVACITISLKLAMGHHVNLILFAKLVSIKESK